MQILIFKRCQSEPVETIKCDEFSLYRNEGEDFMIHYTVYEEDKPCDYILTPDAEVYDIDII